MAIRESQFQSKLIKKLKLIFPDCLVYKMDASYKNGTPDLLVLYRDKWAALEVKKDGKASHRPHQDFYVQKMNEMSYAAFIFPENEEEVIGELRKVFKTK